MAEKGFGVKEVNLIGPSGTPTITSPNNLNLNAVNVAISTNVSIGGTLSVTGNVSIGGTLTYEDVTNIDSVGIVTAREGVIIPDNKVLSLGNRLVGSTAGDLRLYHNGSHSYIDELGTGNLYIRNGSKNSIWCQTDGQVNLYYNDNAKLSTSNTGVTVSGTLVATTFSGSGASLTSLPAANLTGTLPAISGANLTNLPVTDPSNSDIQVVYNVTANGSSSYRFAGNGVESTSDNPNLYLIRGQKYRFINNSGGSHPFQIRESSGGTAYSTGVTNNGASSGNIDFAPTFDSPAQLVYQCTSHGGMVGNIYLRDAAGQNRNVGLTTFVAGIDVDGGPINIINGGGAYNTHLNYNDTGINYVTSTNGGGTYFRGSSNSVTAMAVQGSGPVDIDGDLRHLGDTDTMMQFGTDTISFDTAGSERLRIDSNGLIHAKTRSAEVRRMILSGSPSNSAFNIEAHDGESGTSFGDVQGKLGLFYNDGSTLTNTANISFERGTSAADGAMAFVTNQTERLRIKSNGTVNIGTNNQTSGNSSSKLRVGTAVGSELAICVMGNGGTTTPALYITNWSGSQASNKSIIHFDNSGWGSHQIGSLAGSDGFGIYDDSVLRMSINNVGNTTFHSTGHIVLPTGTTAQRVNTTAALRYNSDLGNLEFYDGSAWKRVRLLEPAPTTGLLAYWPFSTASRSGSTYNDVSGNGQHLTVNGTITDDTTETKFNGCIDFGTADGNHYLKSSSSSFTDIDASSGYSGLSVSVWVKTTVTNNYQQWIISEGTVNTRWNYFVENATGPKWRSVNTNDITMSGSMMTGNWHHLVVTYNSSNNLISHYRDGILTNTGTTGTPSFTGGYLLIGQHSSLTGNSASYRWRGKMAHMRLYNRVLTSTEVSVLSQQW